MMDRPGETVVPSFHSPEYFKGRRKVSLHSDDAAAVVTANGDGVGGVVTASNSAPAVSSASTSASTAAGGVGKGISNGAKVQGSSVVLKRRPMNRPQRDVVAATMGRRLSLVQGPPG